MPLYLSNILFSVVVDAVDAPLDEEELLWKNLGRFGECSDRSLGLPDSMKVFSDRASVRVMGCSEALLRFSDRVMGFSEAVLRVSLGALGRVGHFLNHLWGHL